MVKRKQSETTGIEENANHTYKSTNDDTKNFMHLSYCSHIAVKTKTLATKLTEMTENLHANDGEIKANEIPPSSCKRLTTPSTCEVPLSTTTAFLVSATTVSARAAGAKENALCGIRTTDPLNSD
jgi:hypothetical protein